MSRNGSGVYSLPAGNPVVTGATIQSTWANTTLSDIATSLTQSVSADGQTPITANLPMGSFKLTGLAAGTTAGDSVRYEQFASPPAIGGTAAAAGTFTQVTSTVATGTAPLVVASTTEVANLKAATATTATNQSGGTVAATTISASGVVTSTVATGTAPFVVASTTEVVNLRAATATNISGTVPIANGGTGQTTTDAAFLALAGTYDLSAQGYAHFAGLVFQWGSAGLIATNATVAPVFPIAFPTGCRHVFMTPDTIIDNNMGIGFSATSLTTTGFTAKFYSTNGQPLSFRYFAIGY